MLIHTRVLRARAHAKLSQVDLSRRVGVSRSAVSQWESATGADPTSKNLGLIAKVCGVSYEWLATGRGSMAREAGGEEAPPAHMDEFVQSDVELRLLTQFRRLPRSRQAMVLTLVGALVNARD